MSKPTLQQALGKLKPGSTAAKVRAVMPQIEDQIANGVPLADIVAALNEGGLDLAFRNFETILYRYRKKHGHSGTAVKPPAESTPVVAESTQEPEPEQASAPNEPDREAFERTLNPETRYKTADRLMQGSRRFGHHTKRKDEK